MPLEQDVAAAIQTLKETKQAIAQLEAQKTNLVNEMEAYAGPKQAEADKLVADAKVQAQKILDDAAMVKTVNDAEAKRQQDAADKLLADQNSVVQARSQLVTDQQAFHDAKDSWNKSYDIQRQELVDANTKLTSDLAALASMEQEVALKANSLNVKEADLEAAGKDLDEQMAALKVAQDQLAIDQAALATNQKAVQAVSDANTEHLGELDSRQKAQDAKDVDLGNREAVLTQGQNDLATREQALKDKSASLDAQAKANQDAADANAATLDLISVKKQEVDDQIAVLNQLKATK